MTSALAFVCTYNEADIIGWTVAHLKRQGCQALVIDCESTDGTRDIAAHAGAWSEMYDKPPVSWHAMLGRIEDLTSHAGQIWCVHCDADELRYSDVPGETLVEGFARVQAAGCNAIDHEVMTFHPTEDGYDGSQNPEKFFRYYSDDPLNQAIGQVKAWQHLGPVSLAHSGGHQVQFPGRRIYPWKFRSKHYPIRSQAQGERKVFRERQWLDQRQGRRDWHVQYQGIQRGHNFSRSMEGLREWSER